MPLPEAERSELSMSSSLCIDVKEVIVAPGEDTLQSHPLLLGRMVIYSVCGKLYGKVQEAPSTLTSPPKPTGNSQSAKQK